MFALPRDLESISPEKAPETCLDLYYSRSTTRLQEVTGSGNINNKNLFRVSHYAKAPSWSTCARKYKTQIKRSRSISLVNLEVTPHPPTHHHHEVQQRKRIT